MALADLKVLIALEGGAAVVQGLSAVDAGMHKVASSASGALSSGISRAVEAMRTLGAITLATSAAIGGLASVSAFQTAVKLDSLTRGLASVSVNAADLRAQLSRLREVAKLPGLGFEEAVQGSVALQSAGLSARLSERSLMAFGNALATVGKGKADLNGVTLALQQISAKGKVSAEEINQINERVPQIRKAMQSAFGTSDTEALSKMGISTTQFIEGVVKQLEKLPKITGGIGNDIENLQDGIKNALLPLGNGLVAMFTAVGGTMEKSLAMIERLATSIGDVLIAIGKSGVLTDVLAGITKSFKDAFGSDLQMAFATFAGNVLSFFKNLFPIVKALGSYLSDTFSVIAENINRLFGHIAGKAPSASGTKSAGDDYSDYLRKFYSQENAHKYSAPNIYNLDGPGVLRKLERSPLEKYSTPKETDNMDGPGVLRKLEKILTTSPLGDEKTMHSQIGQSVSTDPLHAAKQWWKELNSTAPSWLSPILGVVSRMSDVGDMKFKALPDPSKYFSNPMDQYSKDADSYRKAIYNSIEPQGLPDNLSFGGVQAKAQSASSGIWAQWDKYLAGIEKNTKKTSDILDSRHTLGGGELARAGVSGSEMARYAAARYQRLYGRG